jgi:hypothetical protein
MSLCGCSRLFGSTRFLSRIFCDVGVMSISPSLFRAFVSSLSTFGVLSDTFKSQSSSSSSSSSSPPWSVVVPSKSVRPCVHHLLICLGFGAEDAPMLSKLVRDARAQHDRLTNGIGCGATVLSLSKMFSALSGEGAQHEIPLSSLRSIDAEARRKIASARSCPKPSSVSRQSQSGSESRLTSLTSLDSLASSLPNSQPSTGELSELLSQAQSSSRLSASELSRASSKVDRLLKDKRNLKRQLARCHSKLASRTNLCFKLMQENSYLKLGKKRRINARRRGLHLLGDM